MEQNLEKRNETPLTKSNIAEFVHDMKELEIKQFTLDQLHSACVGKREKEDRLRIQKLEEAEKTLEHAKINYQTAKQNLEEILKNKQFEPNEIIEEPQEPDEPSLLSGEFAPLLLMFLTPVFIIDLIIWVVKKSKYKKKYQIYSEKYQKYSLYCEYEICNTRYSEAQEGLRKAEKQNQAIQFQIQKLDCISQYLSEHISIIEEKKNQLYTLGIVPRDYRTLDCMIEIDQMFQNDLVDTMREAIMIYEERVFRGELIRGIDNIYNMLGQLTSAMRHIESALYSIRNNVHVMSDDIYKIASSSENMLAETRAARYATEAVQTSTERCEWYLEKQYSKS